MLLTAADMHKPIICFPAIHFIEGKYTWYKRVKKSLFQTGFKIVLFEDYELTRNSIQFLEYTDTKLKKGLKNKSRPGNSS